MLRLLLACALAAAAPAGRVAVAFTCTRQDAVCTALGELYAAAGGASWYNNSGWGAAAASGSAANYCAFYGVECNAAGRLTRLCVRHSAPVRHAPCFPPFFWHALHRIHKRTPTRQCFVRSCAVATRRSLLGNHLVGTLPSLNALTYLQRLCVARRARSLRPRRRMLLMPPRCAARATATQ
jgi:hypothetical protein